MTVAVPGERPSGDGLQELRDSLVPNSGVGLASTNGASTSRVIKRYSNRKLYDTKSSRYVTLPQIAELLRTGEHVQIVDNRTKEDKTEVTLALIISEELRVSPRGIPLATLTALITRPSDLGAGDALLAVPGAPGSGAELASDGGSMANSQDNELRARFEAWCAALDSRMNTLPDPSEIRDLEAEIHRLNDRLAELERRLATPRE